MKLVTLDKKSLKKYTIDPEMLQKAGRPCVLVVKLRYKGYHYDFAVPFRSNIHPSTPKEEYFPLPTRASTKPKHRHGLHYAKMFPIEKDIAIRFRTEGNLSATLYKSIIDSNEKLIIKECQEYLNNYEHGHCPAFSTNIDLLIKKVILKR